MGNVVTGHCTSGQLGRGNISPATVSLLVIIILFISLVDNGGLIEGDSFSAGTGDKLVPGGFYMEDVEKE